MKRTLALTLGAAMLASAAVSPASADWHGFYGYHDGHYGWHHGHGWVPGQGSLTLYTTGHCKPAPDRLTSHCATAHSQHF